MNMAHGPCIGMNKLDRWNRVNKLGLNAPKEAESVLKLYKVRSESLWDGRVQICQMSLKVDVVWNQIFKSLVQGHTGITKPTILIK